MLRAMYETLITVEQAKTCDGVGANKVEPAPNGGAAKKRWADDDLTEAKRIKRDIHFDDQDDDWPDGDDAKTDVLQACRNGWDILVLEGAGGFADTLAARFWGDIYYQPSRRCFGRQRGAAARRWTWTSMKGRSGSPA